MSSAADKRPVPFVGSVVVLSPHLDDAVLSLGASIASSTRHGATIRVVTVFGNDPATTRLPSSWDLRCGFTSASESARGRRSEDLAACERIGATPVWLAYPDVDYDEGRDADRIGAAIDEAIAGADAVLVPGSPLVHPDHRQLTEIALARRPRGMRFGLFAEQPYVFWEFVGSRSRPARVAAWSRCLLRTRGTRRLLEPITPAQLAPWAGAAEWQVFRPRPADEITKLRAIREYKSQLRGFGRLLVPQLTLVEWSRGGESVAWLAPV
jgi:LmbE family N-acetylglucosaminyl deacetylase